MPGRTESLVVASNLAGSYDKRSGANLFYQASFAGRLFVISAPIELGWLLLTIIVAPAFTMDTKLSHLLAEPPSRV